MSEKHSKPWFDPPAALNDGSKVAIIGGGISGLMMASYLSKHFEITLIEEKKSIMAGASGNPAAILDPYIALNQSIEKKFYLKAFEYAVDFYNTLPEDVFHKCGLLKLSKDKKEQRRFNKLSEQYPTTVMQKTKEGLFFPNAGYINPKKLGAYLSNNFETLLNSKVTKITNSDKGKWILIHHPGNERLLVDAVIICNSYNSKIFEQSNHLKFDEVSGQISYIKTEKVIDKIYCSDGYLTPAIEIENGYANICGATFDRDDIKDINDISHQKNIQKSPIPLNSSKILGGRREIRAMTNDHLPVCGALPKFNEYQRLYKDLHHGPNHKEFDTASYHSGLYISAGLGSRGFLTAPLLSDYLTSLIRDCKKPIKSQIQHALHPARFMIRKLSKK